MSKTIAFVNQKGGVGKTSVAVHFAWWIHNRGKQVQVIDCDAQASCLTWLQLIDSEFPVIAINNPDDLVEQASNLAESCDYLVIDGPGQIAEITRSILLVCDLAVIPCQPSGLDLHSSNSVFRLIRNAQKVRDGMPHAASFLNRAFSNTNLKSEAANVLAEIEDASFFKSVIHQRQCITDCFGQETTVWGLKTPAAKKAAEEFESLFKEIMRPLK